jgi:peptidoglycan hydrolase-like protein with peptidoglycan-binding domain
VRRRRFLTVLGGAAVVIAVPSSLVLARGADASKSPSSKDSSTTVTAKVTRRDLAERVDYDGTLGYGDAHQVALTGAGGTITALPPVGTVVDRGDTIAEVDGRPVVVFFGERPMWRALGEGADDGADVEQVEQNLIALGYATDAQLGPNEKWSAATTTAIKKWQKALGVEQTGVVDPSAVVMSAGPVRVSKHIAEPGAPASGPAVEATGTTQLVTVALPAKRQSTVKAGDAVQVTLPDGSAANATVFSVGSVATSEQQGAEPTVPVVVVLNETVNGAGLDQAPVKMSVTTTAASGVLAVPVEALLALSEGGYAVEKSDGTLVGVTLGAFADGWAQVTGDLSEGDDVVVAR